MENTQDNNSNSGSDISDTWSVIDDDSPLEWNNVIGLGLRPHQNDYINSNTTLGLPSRSNSRNELSDEESIEVVAEDHADDLSDKDMEVVQVEECTMANQLETKENINQDLPHDTKPSQQKKENIQWAESNPILITILIVGILAGLFVGYLYASHSHESEVSTSIQSTRALLRKLQSDNLFLRRRLRLARTYMKATVAKTVQNLNDSTKHDSAHTSLKSANSKTIPSSDHLSQQVLHNKINQHSLNLSDSGTCSVTDFMVIAPIHDYCLVSEKPHSSENVWNYTDIDAGNDSMSVGIASASSSVNTGTSSVKDYLQTENTGVNNIKSNEPLGTLHDSQNNDTLHGGRTWEDMITRGNIEGKTDPRPYTKLRTTVEKIYSILSILDNGKHTVFPSKQEMLSILPQNYDLIGLSKQHFTSNTHEKIASFELQMQDATQKLFDEMDSRIDNLVENIAFKFKEIQCFNVKLICDLKSSIENSPDTDLLDLNQITLFQKCLEDQECQHGHMVKTESQYEINGKCSGSEKYVGTADESIIYDQNHPIDPLGVLYDEYTYSDTENVNVQQNEKQTGNYELGKTSSLFGHKRSPAPKIDFVEDECQIIDDSHITIEHEASTYLNRKSKIDESSKEIKKKIIEIDKVHKTQAKHPDYVKINKHEESETGTKRIFEKKYNEARGKKYSADKNYVKSSKHDKSSRNRMYDIERKYDEAYGKRKYSDDLADHVKTKKREKSDKIRISENKGQKYDEYHDKKYSDNNRIKIRKHEKSGKKRMSDNKDQKYDEAYGKTKYSDYDDRVKFRKHGQSGKKTISDNKKQKYGEAYGKTEYSDDDDHVKIRQREKSVKKKMFDNKEQKYDKSHIETMFSNGDDSKINIHEVSGKKKMSDINQQEYNEDYGETNYSGAKKVKREKSGKKRTSENKQQKYDEARDKTKYSDDLDNLRLREYEKSDKKIISGNKGQIYDESHSKIIYSDDVAKIKSYEGSGKMKMSDNKEQKYDDSYFETNYSDKHVNINKDEESGKTSDDKQKKYSDAYGKGQQKRNRSRRWKNSVNKASNVSGEWVTQMAHGRAEQRRRDHESDWVFDRAESREFNRKKSTKHSHYSGDQDYSGKFFNSGVCNKTRTFKDEMSNKWKMMKQCMKENIWKPILNTSRSAKKTFNKFRYHSRRE